MSRPRIVFFGTPAFAVPSFEACVELGQVVAVVTQPDRAKGRGQAVQPSPVKAAALAKGLTVLQPPKLKTPPFAKVLEELHPDVAVVTAYGRILPPDVLGTPAHGCINVHGSLLPRWRGAAPIQWAIAAGDRETGVCLMQMDEGLDTGPELARRALPIQEDDTSESLHQKLAPLGAALLKEYLPGILSGAVPPSPQPSLGVTLAPPIDKEQGALDFGRPAAELERRVRAFYPWPGSFTYLEGAILKVHRARVGMGMGAPGEVLQASAELEVACQEGSLKLLDVQPAGGKRMTAGQFLQGHRVGVGSKPFALAPA
jgi:methionyl-tRNA formyltransferase